MKRSVWIPIIATTGLIMIGVYGGAAARASGSMPSVTSVSPSHGPLGGGTIVNINGSNLVNVTGVDFGLVSATFVPRSNNLVQAIAPAGTGTVDIEVTTTTGTSLPVSADHYTYVTTPVIQGIDPRIGAGRGGNRVTISGSDFNGVTAVDFGLTPATSYTRDSPNAITAITPAHALGTVNVTVTAADGTTPVDLAGRFTYVPRVPVVTSVVFDVGNQAGGDVVTITGQRFLSDATVDFGLAPAPSVTFVNSTTLEATSPPGSGTVEITVNTSKGASVLNPPIDDYMYTATGP